MKTTTKVIPGIYISLLILMMACEDKGEDNPANLIPPIAEAVAVGNLQPASIVKNDKKYYKASVMPGKRYSVSISNLADNTISLSLADDKFFTEFSIFGTTGTSASSIKEMQVTTTGTELYFMIDGMNINSLQSEFSILVIPVSEELTFVNQGSSETPLFISIDQPTSGEVETRGVSYYAFKNIQPGPHYTLSILALTNDADLHIYHDEIYSLEFDATLRKDTDVSGQPEDCKVLPAGDIYFTVRGGELNRIGARFIMLIKPE